MVKINPNNNIAFNGIQPQKNNIKQGREMKTNIYEVKLANFENKLSDIEIIPDEVPL